MGPAPATKRHQHRAELATVTSDLRGVAKAIDTCLAAFERKSMPEDVCGPRLRALRDLVARVEVAGRHQVTPWFRVPTCANTNTLPVEEGVRTLGSLANLTSHNTNSAPMVKGPVLSL
jgi:hypothetical protein